MRLVSSFLIGVGLGVSAKDVSDENTTSEVMVVCMLLLLSPLLVKTADVNCNTEVDSLSPVGKLGPSGL